MSKGKNCNKMFGMSISEGNPKALFGDKTPCGYVSCLSKIVPDKKAGYAINLDWKKYTKL